LLSDGSPVLGDEADWYPAAVLDVIAVVPCPGADGHVIDGALLAAAGGGGGCLARGAGDLAGAGDVRAERGAQLVVVLAAEVDFVFCPVKGEADGAVGLAAVDVVDEERLDLLGYEISSTCRVADCKEV
jgi:hypothetical protein